VEVLSSSKLINAGKEKVDYVCCHSATKILNTRRAHFVIPLSASQPLSCDINFRTTTAEIEARDLIAKRRIFECSETTICMRYLHSAKFNMVPALSAEKLLRSAQFKKRPTSI